MKHHDTRARQSDRVLFAALAIILAMVSAVLGAALSHRSDVPIATMAKPAPALPTSHDMVLAQLIAEHRCLTEVLYYEARGEGSSGEQAVAEVVFHRMNNGDYGHSICAVVYEGAGRPGCQFSFACNGDLHRPREAAAWERAEQLAAQILTGEVPLRNATAGATFYHADWMRPYWAPTLKRTTQIGHHIFYRGI